MKKSIRITAAAFLVILSVVSYVYLEQQRGTIEFSMEEIQEDSYNRFNEIGLPDVFILRKMVEQAKRVLPTTL